MKKSILKYIALFLGLIFIIDIGIGSIIKKKFNTISFGDYGTINRALASDSDVLILGSSRAQHHYNPEIIGNKLNLSCFNAGLGGHGLFYNYAILNEIIKNKNPEIVILDISPNIIVDPKGYSKLNILLPYYINSESFKEIIQLNPKFSKLELLSNLYVYNSTIYDIIRTSINNKDGINNGYSPLIDKINVENYTPFYLIDEEQMDDNNIDYLIKIIQLCNDNNINLLGVVSPTFEKFDSNNRIINKIDSIFNKHKTPFYNYSNDSELYGKYRFFKDQLHLNKEGAKLFSTSLAQKLNIRK